MDPQKMSFQLFVIASYLEITKNRNANLCCLPGISLEVYIVTAKTTARKYRPCTMITMCATAIYIRSIIITRDSKTIPAQQLFISEVL